MKLRVVNGKFISDEPVSLKQNDDGTISMTSISGQRKKEIAKTRAKNRTANKQARKSRKGR